MLGGVGQLMRPSLVSGDYLVAPGILLPPLTLTRAQASGARSTALNADGTTWSEFGADIARFNGTARRLLIEGQRTNGVADARTIGGTGWSNNDVTRSAIVGPDGVAGSASRLNEGTTAAVHYTFSGNASYVSGTSYVLSAIVRPGTCSTCQIAFPGASHGLTAFANFDLSGAGAVGSVGAAVTRSNIRKIGDWFWIEIAAPATATVSSAASVLAMTNSSTAVRLVSYTGTSRTLDAFWVWNEAATFASTPVLPASGTPAASTRGADLISATLAALGIGANGACTVLWGGVIPQNAPSSAQQVLFSIDDGTANNRFFFRNLAGGASIQVGRVLAGASSPATAGTLVAGTPLSVGASIDGTGRAAMSVSGAAVAAVTGGPTSGLTTFRLGTDVSGANPVFGETARLSILPYALSDAALQAAVAAFPTA